MNESESYMTSFSGELDLSSIDQGIKSDLYTKIKRVIDQKLNGLANLDDATDMLYINGSIDDSEEIVEKLLYLISTKILLSDDVVIKAQGSDPKDRWDLILKPDGVYIQEYELTPGTLRKYK